MQLFLYIQRKTACVSWRSFISLLASFSGDETVVRIYTGDIHEKEFAENLRGILRDRISQLLGEAAIFAIVGVVADAVTLFSLLGVESLAGLVLAFCALREYVDLLDMDTRMWGSGLVEAEGYIQRRARARMKYGLPSWRPPTESPVSFVLG